MTETVPTTSKGSIPADLKGPAGSGLNPTKSEPSISLSPDFKSEIRKIVAKYASNKKWLTPDEFRNFLQIEQKTSQVPIEEEVTSEELEKYLLSPANTPIHIPECDLSHPLKDYFISSSHNTYLVGNQLYGDASTEGYKTVLQKGCRCIEIDCWDGDNGEPKVSHGYTAVDPITFRVVCQAIAKYAFCTTDLPLIVSLEIHCSIEQQKKMVEILNKEFGEYLLKDKVEGVHLDTLPSPIFLKNKILLKSKYLPPDSEIPIPLSPTSTMSSMSSTSEDEYEPDPEPEPEPITKTHNHRIRLPHRPHRHRRPKVKILRQLSDLGIYTTSTHYHSFSNPLSKLFNHVHSFSERVFKKLLEESPRDLNIHNKHYLTRVYPFGLRVGSSNQKPLVPWQMGAQLVALNWQKFDLGMMLNEALFTGSGGMVLKPPYIHHGDKPVVALSIEVIGASGLPCPENVKDLSKLDPYVKIELLADEKMKRQTKTRKNTGANVIWNEILSFPTIEDNLAFVRFLVYHDEIGKDILFAVYTARLDVLQPGYRLLRLFDVEGRQIPGAVLMIRVIKSSI